MSNGRDQFGDAIVGVVAAKTARPLTAFTAEPFGDIAGPVSADDKFPLRIFQLGLFASELSVDLARQRFKSGRRHFDG